MSISQSKDIESANEVRQAYELHPKDEAWAVEASRAEEVLMPPRSQHDIRHSRRMREPLPIYIENEGSQITREAPPSLLSAYHLGRSLEVVVLPMAVEGRRRPAAEKNIPILYYPEGSGFRGQDSSPWHRGFRRESNPLIRAQQKIVISFFDAIATKQDDAVAFFIGNNYVTANTTNHDGTTPLLAAVNAGSVGIVRELIEFGADHNAFGVEKIDYRSSRRLETIRTPLQLAASIGNLTLVKLFIECYQCDDSLIAPDGQSALRLAVDNGNREIVQYLPVRRGGGWRRWKIHHADSWKRVQKALENSVVIWLLKVIPKYFFWDLPKALIVELRREGFWPWVGRNVRKILKAIASAGKAAWHFGIDTLPKWSKSLLLERIPKATAIAVKWIWNGLALTSVFFWHTILKTASLFDTVFRAIITFFRNATLKDIWIGFCDLLSLLFVAFPKQLWVWLAKFAEASCHFMTVMFGDFGTCVWFIAYGLGWLVVYIPLRIAKGLGWSIGKTLHEFRVWVNPRGMR